MKKIYKILLICGLLIIAFAGFKNKPGDDIDKSNPFFTKFNTPFEVPPFEKIMAKHYMPAFNKGMADGRADLKNITNNRSIPTYQNTIEALDKAGDLLTKVSSVFFSQTSANTNDSLQKIEVDVSPLLSAYRDEILLDSALFRRVKTLYDGKEKLSLTPEQDFLLVNLYKNFVRNGALLKGANQDTLKKLNEEVSVLSVKFSQNVLGENNKFKLVIDNKDDLKGLPEGVINGAADRAKKDSLGGINGYLQSKSQVCSLSLLMMRKWIYVKSCMMDTLQKEIMAIILIIIRF
jgi:peptidyl-dipeptidase Dcp